MTKKPLPIILLPLLLLLGGCNDLIVKIYGFKTEYDPITPEQRGEALARFGLEGESWHELNTAFIGHIIDTFYKQVQGKDSTEQHQLADAVNNHLQMLQAMYFDRAGRLVSYHLNCYAEGFPNMNWNMNDAFSTFPPASVAPPDTLVPLPALLPHIRNAQGRPLAFDPDKGSDYTVVVFWPGFCGRQSKRLIRTVRDNLALAPDSLRVEALFVNDDWFYIQMDSIVEAKRRQHEPQP